MPTASGSLRGHRRCGLTAWPLLKLQAELGDSPLRMPPGLRLRRPAQARLLALAAAVGGKGAASAMLQAHAAMNHSDVPAQYQGLKP